MPTSPKSWLSLCLAIAAFIANSSLASADEIVIYRSVQTEKCVSHYQPTSYEYFDEELGEEVTEEVPGGRSTYRNKTTSYVIVNKTTAEYREITYYDYSYRDKFGKKVKARAYYLNGDYSELDEGSPFSSFFETDPEARKNYLVLSFIGTSESFDTYFTESDGFGAFSATNTDTLSGVVKTQKFNVDGERVAYLFPSTIKGDNESESESVSSDDGSINRTQCHGKRTLTLDKKRSSATVSELKTLAEAEAEVMAYLESKGYEFLDIHGPVVD